MALCRHYRAQISLNGFEKINWLSINDCFKQFIASTNFHFFSNKSSLYMNVFKPTGHSNTNTSKPFLKLSQLLRETNCEQKTLSYIAPTIWNGLPNSLKATECLNTYKHEVKKHFLDRMKNREKYMQLLYMLLLYLLLSEILSPKGQPIKTRPKGTLTQAVKHPYNMSDWVCLQRSAVGQFEQHEDAANKY